MSNVRAEIHRRIFLFLSIGLVFFIPIAQHILPPVIILMTLNWLIDGRYIKNFPLIFKEKHRLLTFGLALLYVYYLIGILWSENYDYGWFDLEVKFSLFLFPLIFATTDKSSLNSKYRQNVLWAFVISCLTGMLILCINAFYRYSLYHIRDVFFYGGFCDSFHASYLAMYLVFATSIVAWFLMDKSVVFSSLLRYLLFGLILFFLVMVFLLNSRAGILGLFLLIILVTLFLAFSRKKWSQSILFFIAGSSILFITYQLFPSAAEHFSNTSIVVDPRNKKVSVHQNESNSLRILSWKASLQVILENPLVGVGTGDVKDALMEQYKKNGSTIPLHLKLNAHNQYLQTFATLGILGLFLLLLLLFQSAILSFRYKDYLYFAFLVLVAFNLLVESMLEQQAGVIFFAFFNTFFFVQASDNNKKKPPHRSGF